MDVDIVAKSLKKYGYDAAPIHGDLDQSQRMKTLDGFRDGALKFLVASDVAARGLDVPSVSHVFNFDVPGHAEDYVHRIGRTGRAGRDGKAITICSTRDEKLLEAVESLVQKEITRLDNPVKIEPRKPRKAAAEADAPKDEKKTRNRKSAAKTDDRVEAAVNPNNLNTADPKPQRGRGGKGRNDRGDRRDDRVVVGMGDHMPSFIALSFAERRAS